MAIIAKHASLPRDKSLGHTDNGRKEAYSELFCYELETGEIEKIRIATSGNFALGNHRFHEEISIVPGRRVSPGKAGRSRIR